MKKRSGRRMSFLTKVMIGVFAIYAAVTLRDLRVQIRDKEAEVALLVRETQDQEAVNAELREIISEAGSEDLYADVAREKLGYVRRGERVWKDISSM